MTQQMQPPPLPAQPPMPAPPAQPWPQPTIPVQPGPSEPYGAGRPYPPTQQYAPPLPPAPAGYPAPPRRRTGLIVGSVIGGLIVIAGVIVGAVLLFGKTTLDSAKLQHEITQLAQDKAGVAATDVSCPADREAKAGDEFTCTAQLDGQPARFTVTQQDDKGNVHVQLANSLVIVSQLENLLSQQAEKDYGFSISSSCDTGGHSVVVDGVGKSIDCTLINDDDHGDTLDVVATVDSQGHVSYKEA
jgi:hypothetical protein